MTDPVTTTISTVLGVKWAAVLAGAVGAVISLRYIDDLSMIGRILAIFTGALFAGYVSPAVAVVLSLSPPGQNAAAFMLGLTAMNILPGVMRLSEQFASDPLSFIRANHKRRKDDPHD